MDFGKIIAVVFLFVVIFSIICILLAIPTFFLWNWLMPAIFGIKTITFGQAIGLNFLTGILFKNTTTSSSKK